MSIKLSEHIRNEELCKLNRLILLVFKYRLLFLIRKFIEIFLGIRIPTNSLDKKLRLAHPFTIEINEKAKLGNNVTIYKNSLIGNTQFGNRQGVPTIEDNVMIYFGSIITGNIKIGKNSIIGRGGNIVTKNIPANEIWAGNPAKCIGYINDNE